MIMFVIILSNWKKHLVSCILIGNTEDLEMGEIKVVKELKVDMTFYMEMKDDETEQEAIDRFYKEFTTENMTTESSIQVYDMEVQEM
ncbi:MAG: hypothetical protein PUC23_03405 [bacterium]|nr:hypothetical protein [bacterium]